MPKRTYENHYGELHTVLDNITTNIRDIEKLLVLDNFLSTLDLFKKETMKLEVCEKTLRAFTNACVDKQISDPVLINALMYVSKTLSESVKYVNIFGYMLRLKLMVFSLNLVLLQLKMSVVKLVD